MRRMLDPKTLGGGGGSGGTPRHAYRIIKGNSLWYISNTRKDYDQFKIGKMTDATQDILSNDEYQELLSIGTHNAGGIIDDSGEKNLVNWLRIDSKNELGYYECTCGAYRLQTNTIVTMSYKIKSASIIKIVKLFEFIFSYRTSSEVLFFGKNFKNIAQSVDKSEK